MAGKEQAKQELKKVKARVISDGSFGRINDVVEVTEAEAKNSPELDADPGAVAYAESLKTDESQKIAE